MATFHKSICPSCCQTSLFCKYNTVKRGEGEDVWSHIINHQQLFIPFIRTGLQIDPLFTLLMAENSITRPMSQHHPELRFKTRVSSLLLVLSVWRDIHGVLNAHCSLRNKLQRSERENCSSLFLGKALGRRTCHWILNQSHNTHNKYR